MVEQYEGRVAVVTGSASGIGKAIAERCCAKGMKVVIADIEKDGLEGTEEELKAKHGAAVTSVVTDVSNREDIETLARRTVDTYGAVHLLCNNAGIAAAGSILQSSIEDYRWVLDVNLWGVIYGMTTFLPMMLEQNDRCHIVNTSSGAGITPSNAEYLLSQRCLPWN
jgi:NADP-dependent 3-hydroxy acid dehydrogenase YdfG|tara:strand:+ start:720 stop:1220 length:501 start_codon:yes stop_codon:yes gene_type:complete